MTPDRQVGQAPLPRDAPALAAFLDRRGRIIAAYHQAWDQHEACSFPLTRQACHDRLVRLAAVLLGVDPDVLLERGR